MARQVRGAGAVDQHVRAAGIRRHAAARRHQPYQPHPHPQHEARERRRFCAPRRSHRRRPDRSGGQRHDLRARPHRAGHLGRDVLGRLCAVAKAQGRSRETHASAGVDGRRGERAGAEASRRAAHRNRDALLAGRRPQRRAVFFRGRVRGGADDRIEMPEPRRHRACERGRAQGRGLRRRHARHGRHHPGRHQPRDGAARARGRAPAVQTGGGDQHGDLLGRAALARDRRPGRGLGPAVGKAH